MGNIYAYHLSYLFFSYILIIRFIRFSHKPHCTVGHKINAKIIFKLYFFPSRACTVIFSPGGGGGGGGGKI